MQTTEMRPTLWIFAEHVSPERDADWKAGLTVGDATDRTLAPYRALLECQFPNTFAHGSSLVVLSVIV